MLELPVAILKRLSRELSGVRSGADIGAVVAGSCWVDASGKTYLEGACPAEAGSSAYFEASAVFSCRVSAVLDRSRCDPARKRPFAFDSLRGGNLPKSSVIAVRSMSREDCLDLGRLGIRNMELDWDGSEPGCCTESLERDGGLLGLLPRDGVRKFFSLLPLEERPPSELVVESMASEGTEAGGGGRVFLKKSRRSSLRSARMVRSSFATSFRRDGIGDRSP
jgi:hypothetical protein